MSVADTRFVAQQADVRGYLPWLLAALAGLTAFRMAALHWSIVDFHYDEAQYWAWAQKLAPGYFSKPPLLAWVIGATETVCGSGEACIRSASPLFYFATALLTYFIALRLYDPRTAFWSALCLSLAPGVLVSSRIISTDVPLLFFWALALLAWLRLLEGPDWRWSLTLGLALGLGMLAKYAMIYFALGAALAAWLEPRARAPLSRWWAPLAIAGLVLLPNVIWIASHDWATFRHVGENASGTGLRFNPLGALQFVGSQFGVIGPIVFAVFILVLVRPKLVAQPQDRIMLAFALPPLVLVTGAGLLTQAFGNWAAPSAISLCILAAAILVRHGARWALAATALMGLALQAALPAADSRADKVSLPFLARGDVYAVTMGWRGLADGVERTADASQAAGIVADRRDVTASLIYYLRDTGRPIFSWRTGERPAHHFDIDRPLTRSASEPLLYVTYCPWPKRLEPFFATIETLPPIVASAGPNSRRRLIAYRLAGARGNDAPLGPCIR